jgi:hypothetical protein
MAEKVQFTNSQMLKWMEYVADMQGVSAEKIKMLNTCSKRRNVLATIATHKRVLIFADSTYPNMLYKCWEAGYGDYEMYFGEGYEPSEMKHCKVSDMMDGNLEGPTVIYIVNENTRESMIFGMKNDNFSSGMVKYVGHEIRAVIMNKLEMDVRDTVLLANAESIAVEASMVAYEGLLLQRKEMQVHLEQWKRMLLSLVPIILKLFLKLLLKHWKNFQRQDLLLSWHKKVTSKMI